MNRQTGPEITSTTGRLVALYLWHLGAVKVNLDQPFRLASGNYSPIYINCRQLISSVSFMDLFAAASRQLLGQSGVEFEVIAGGETAGIPFAAFLARTFGKPMVYVRKAAKDHGLASLVEGVLNPGDSVLLTEDLITDAGSKVHFIEAIKCSGGTVPAVLVVFDRLQGGSETLASMNIRLLSVTDIQTALDVAESARVLEPSTISSVRTYLKSPRDWHAERHLPYTG